MNAIIAKRPYAEDLRIAAVLAVAGALAVAAVIPYVLELMPDIRAKVHWPMWLFMLAQGLQGGVELGLLGFLGLRLGAAANLDAPWLRARLTGRSLPVVDWRTAVIAGAAIAVLIVAFLATLDPMLPPPITGAAMPPAPGALDGFLASFYGAIGEETLMRLFLMTFVLWLVAKARGPALVPGHYWFAIGFCALLFGVGHLPAAAHVWPMTWLVIGRVILGNALAGVVFGWLFWKRGLEAAMIGHFSADLVLHVVAPLLVGTGP